MIPDNATDKSLTYSSDNEAVCGVSSTGMLSALSAGSANISVASAAYPSVVATVSVTVNTPKVPVTGISVDRTASVETGAEFSLTAQVMPDNATNRSISWTIADTSVVGAKTRGQGITKAFTALKAGSTTITVTSKDDPMMLATCSVTVVDPVVEATSVEVSPATSNIAVGETVSLAATVLPENTTDKSVSWASSDETVATVDSAGLVSAVAAGDATITATCGKASGTSAISVDSVEEI